MPVRVVIVEDEWLIAATLRSQMELYGYEVVRMVTSGSEALFVCQQTCPDVVMMDVQLPGKDGLEATQEIMETCPTCVVIVTSRGKLEHAAQQAGAMDYVMKPLLGSQIPRVVEQAQQRFHRFQEVRRQAATPAEAITAWHTIQYVISLLVGREAISEEDAFARIHHEAEIRQVSLHTAAEEIAAQLHVQAA